jgi:hypothetical protein
LEKLRLLLFNDCHRKCPGCCNNDWDLDALPECQSFDGYEAILLTGGEPMLKPRLIERVVCDIRLQNPSAKIYVYTSHVSNYSEAIGVLAMVDGICLTLHKQVDVEIWQRFDKFRRQFPQGPKSLRLNIFKGVKTDGIDFKDWKVKDNMTWIRDCPLPNGEVFMRLRQYDETG